MPLPPSPCVGVCEVDPGVGLCRGCARTAEEIGWWREGPEARRAEVWSALPERARRLGLPFRRLAWEAEEILDFVERTLDARRGRWWILGGARSGAFEAGDAPLSIRRAGEEIVARAGGAKLRLRVERFVRAFEAPQGERPPRLLLVLPVGRAEAARAALSPSPPPGLAEGPLGRVAGPGREHREPPALPTLPEAWSLGAAFIP